MISSKKYIMCHHLHDNKKFLKVKGSVSKSIFKNIVNKNKDKYIFTFDDGLKSQIIAAEFLEKHKLKGIFFINTFQFSKNLNLNEVCKHFIKKYFKSYDDFYFFFISNLKKRVLVKLSEIKNFSNIYPFYSRKEIIIRLIRNANAKIFNETLIKIFDKKKFKYKKKINEIYLNKKEIKKISKKHQIGLHTHTHPYNFDKLNNLKKVHEIKENKKILEKIVGKKVSIFSYPCGKHSKDIISILKKQKIYYAFNNKPIKYKNSRYLIPRTNIIKFYK